MLRPEKMRRVSNPDRNVFDEVLVLIDEPPFVGVAEPLDLWAIAERGEMREYIEMGNETGNCPRRWSRRARMSYGPEGVQGPALYLVESSPWSDFPRKTILLNNDQSSVARAIARDWTTPCASWNPSTAPALLAILETCGYQEPFLVVI